jgi:hypothetical protein
MNSDQAQNARLCQNFQLLIVFFIQVTEPITATVIHPFVNQFVRETRIINGDERKTGYFAGIIVRISISDITGICRSVYRIVLGYGIRSLWEQTFAPTRAPRSFLRNA